MGARPSSQDLHVGDWPGGGIGGMQGLGAAEQLGTVLTGSYR